MDVKLGELGSWIGGRDFTPNGIIAAVRRGKEAKVHRAKLFSAAHLLMCLKERCCAEMSSMIRSAPVISVVYLVPFQATTDTTTSTST